MFYHYASLLSLLVMRFSGLFENSARLANCCPDWYLIKQYNTENILSVWALRSLLVLLRHYKGKCESVSLQWTAWESFFFQYLWAWGKIYRYISNKKHPGKANAPAMQPYFSNYSIFCVEIWFHIKHLSHQRQIQNRWLGVFCSWIILHVNLMCVFVSHLSPTCVSGCSHPNRNLWILLLQVFYIELEKVEMNPRMVQYVHPILVV